MKIYFCDLCRTEFDSVAGVFKAYSATVELGDYNKRVRKVRVEVTRITEPDTGEGAKPEICDDCFKLAMRAAANGEGRYQ